MDLLDDYRIKDRFNLYKQFNFGGESFLNECRNDLKFLASGIEGFIQV